MSPLPTWRVVLLRLCYLVIAGGLGVSIVPRLISLPADWTSAGAVVTSFLTALMTLCALGIFRPLAMLPVLLFELIWKFVFMFRIVLPAWLAGPIDPKFAAVFWECLPILLFVPVIPWRLVSQRYLPRRTAAARSSV
jgi:hypothetical protein